MAEETEQPIAPEKEEANPLTSPFAFFQQMFAPKKEEKDESATEEEKKEETAAGDAAGNSTASEAEGDKAEEEESEAHPPTVLLPPLQPPESPIQSQMRSMRFQPLSAPIEIRILKGNRAGEALDLWPENGSFLGVQIPEVTLKQSAEWKTAGVSHIRDGHIFERISPLTADLSLEFYDPQNDISHLTQQIFACHRPLSDGDRTPEELFVRVGSMTMAPCVITSISEKKSRPLPGAKGYRQAKVDITLQMAGGRGSPNMLADVLAATPIDKKIQAQTLQERQQEATLEVASLLIGQCLGEEGRQSLEKLLEGSGEGLGDKEKIASLDSSTRLQLQIAGMIPKEAVDKEQIDRDLAVLIAQTQPGDITYHDREFADALQKGDPSSLPPEWLYSYEKLKPHYDQVSKAVVEGDLGKDAKIWDNYEAFDILKQVGGCGMRMRSNGSPNIATSIGAEEAESLKKLNGFLGDSSDSEIQKKFGLETESQVRNLRNGQPYQSKAEFLDHVGQTGSGVSAYSLWAEITKLQN